MKPITRPEYTTISLAELGLDRQQAQELRRFLCAKNFPPDVLNFGLDDISTTSYVGVIKYGDMQLNIVPKILGKDDPKDTESCLKNLVFMLGYINKLHIYSTQEAEIATANNPFLEILIAYYARTLLDALHRHIPHHYEVREDNISNLRGRILFPQHFRLNSANQSKLYCQFDEFTSDNLLNQTLKFVAYKLRKHTKNKTTRQQLTKILAVYESISLKEVTYAQTKKIILNRNQIFFQEPLKIARMFLQHHTISLHEHTLTNFAILFDMNLLFEEFVANALTRQFGHQKVRTQEEAKREIITKKHPIPSYDIKPDIILRDTIIIDTKYKVLDLPKKKPSSEDIYQMLAYAHFYPTCKHIILCYPKYKQHYKEQLSLRLYGEKDQLYHISLLTLDLRTPLDVPEQMKKIFSIFNTFSE